MKTTTLAVTLFASSALAAAPLFPKDFSATAVSPGTDAKTRSTTRISASPQKLRLDARMGPLATTTLYSKSPSRYLTLYPNKTFLEAKTPDAMIDGHLARFSAPGGDPCRLKKAKACTKAGADTVAGRAATKWNVTLADGKTATYWVDQELAAIVKAEDPVFTFELADIDIAAVAPELFELPKDYVAKKR